jgi:hypothetical protein
MNIPGKFQECKVTGVVGKNQGRERQLADEVRELKRGFCKLLYWSLLFISSETPLNGFGYILFNFNINTRLVCSKVTPFSM